MKPEYPADITAHAQEDGTVLLIISVNQAVQWIPRGPGELGSELKPFEPPTKVLKFILCASDAQAIGLQLSYQATEAVQMAKMADFNAKASESPSEAKWEGLSGSDSYKG